MKATGMVRRIDDLGRVVIPKEIRRVLNIREGDPLEIFIDETGGVIFKRYLVANLAKDLIEQIECLISDGYELKNRKDLLSKTEELKVLFKKEQEE